MRNKKTVYVPVVKEEGTTDDLRFNVLNMMYRSKSILKREMYQRFPNKTYGTDWIIGKLQAEGLIDVVE
jgi:hypothetical protein